MPVTYTQEQVNSKLQSYLNQKEELIKQRELYQPGTNERKQIQSAINKLSPKIAYLKKSPFCDKKFKRKTKDPEPVKKIFLSNLLAKEFKKVEEKANEKLLFATTDRQKQIIKEQLEYCRLAAKYRYA